jgi:hypothetical protein
VINFLAVTELFPGFLPLVLNAFFEQPTPGVREIVEFCVTQFSQPVLLHLAVEAGNGDFDIEGCRKGIGSMFERRIGEIPELYAGNPSGRTHVLAFVGYLVVFGVDMMAILGVVHEILGMPVDLLACSPMFDLLETILLNDKMYEPSDLFLEYVWQTALVFAEHDQFEELNDALRCLTTVLCRSTTELPRSDPRVSQRIPQLLAAELKFGFDDDENHAGLFDDIVEQQVFLCASDPGPAMEVVMSAFSDSVDRSVFHWCLKIANAFYRHYVEMKENADCIRPMLERILGSPILLDFVRISPLIACEVCRTYEVLQDNVGALAAFRMALDLHSSDDDVMRVAVKLAQRYHFPLESIAAWSEKMSLRVLRMAVSLAPSEFVEEWVGHLMANGSDLALSTAAALICGLLDVVDFDVEPFLDAFVSRRLFYDAIKIARKSPENCARVLAAAEEWQTDQDTSLAFFRSLLKIARALVSPGLTDLVLKIIRVEFLTDYKIGIRVSQLFTEHASKSVPLAPDSVAVLVHCVTGWALDSITLTDNVAEGLIRALSFSFVTAYPMIGDELWVVLIPKLFQPLAGSGRDFSHGSDLLFSFAETDIQRYLWAMRAVLSRASNPDVLLDMLHAELFARPDLTEAKQMALFEDKLHILAKTYLYFEKFV